MSRNWLACCAFAASAFIAGCFVTNEYDTYTDLRRDEPESIRVMSRDTVLYDLSRYALLDSSLQGEGTREAHGLVENFKGEIPFSDIVYVQAQQFSFIRTLLATVSMGAVGAYVGAAGGSSGLRVWRPSSGGSCPYLYAWDGRGYQLQGETFGTGFGTALETTTSCMLPLLMEDQGVVRVRLANERPETHYLNSVSLLACEAPPGATVLLDTDHHPWLVTHPLPPLTCSEGILQQDGIYWKSDLHSARAGMGFRDTIEVTLPKPEHATTGSLVVHAINTHLFNAVYDIVFRFLGDQSLSFLFEAEHNPVLIARLKEWIDESSLTVEFWRDGEWVIADLIPPEADVAPFAKIVRINTAGMEGHELRVRFTTLADTWQIDNVQIDWTPAVPLPVTEQPMLSVLHSVTGAASAAIQLTDREYAIMFPGERIDMTFAPRPVTGRLKVCYFLTATGYLYEWLPEEQPQGVPAFLASHGPDRMKIICGMLHRREVFLGHVYRRWGEIREH